MKGLKGVKRLGTKQVLILADWGKWRRGSFPPDFQG
jgi:hypothetical protein